MLYSFKTYDKVINMFLNNGNVYALTKKYLYILSGSEGDMPIKSIKPEEYKEGVSVSDYYPKVENHKNVEVEDDEIVGDYEHRVITPYMSWLGVKRKDLVPKKLWALFRFS